MYYNGKALEKVVTLRIIVGDLVLNQNLNMALSHYGLNLKELKVKLDALTFNIPKGLYFYFNFILYKNSTYDIILKGPTLSSCVLSVLTNDSILDEYTVTFKELVICYKLKKFFDDCLVYALSFDSLETLFDEYKQLIGTISSFKTL